MDLNSMKVAFQWKGAQVRAHSRSLQQASSLHVEKMEPGSAQQSMIVGWEAVGLTWSKTSLHWRERATFFPVETVQRGANYPERLCCLHPWASPEKALKSPEPCCHTFWYCFEQEVSLGTSWHALDTEISHNPDFFSSFCTASPSRQTHTFSHLWVLPQAS